MVAISLNFNPDTDPRIQEVLNECHAGPTSGVFTDGGAQPNPGPGGWGVVRVVDNKVVACLNGGDSATTNNRMELTALINAYKLIDPVEEETVYSDSEICVKTVNEWAKAWEKRGWRRNGGPIKNLELVQELYALHLDRPKVTLKWVKAHNGWRWNEYADALSTAWVRVERL